LNVLAHKLKEVVLSVAPIAIIVLLLHFTISPIEATQLYRFLVGTLFIVVGLAIFLFGVDIGITPIGELMGSILTKSNKIWILGLGGLLLGFMVSIAEPDLHILAGQVDFVTSGVISKLSIVVVVSLGIAALLSTGLIRIVRNIPLNLMLIILYLIILALSFFTSPEFMAISFDASGATTGALAVPFILALAIGASRMKKGGALSENDSFGLVAIASSGAIIAVMVMSIVSQPGEITAQLEMRVSDSASILRPFIQTLPSIAGEIFIALFPLLAVFLIFRKRHSNSKKARLKVIKGLLYSLIGLVLFLTGVNAGFMDVGSIIGHNLAAMDSKIWVIAVAFLLGLVTILAEPAVYVLTHQIEDITSGYVKRSGVLIALSIGVAVALALSLVRILFPGIELWHLLLPGYIISLALTHFVPKLFVGIAFDAGGVATGPMTATFLLAFAQGAAEATAGADVLIDGFGLIAMVALMPLIALQLLGLIFKAKSIKEGIK